MGEPRQGSALLPVLVGWAAKGSWAIMDQGLFASSNFLLNVMLARWLTPRDYGAFTVAFSFFLFIGAVHFALLIEPMLVFGPAKYAGRYAEYLNTLLLGHWALVAPASLALLLSGTFLALFWPGALSAALVGFAFAGPVILLTWLMRRACYLRSEPRLAALAGLLHLTLMMVGLFALYRQRWLSILSALALLVAVSLLTCLWLSIRLHLPWPSRPPRGVFRGTLKDHWRYGRWAAATMVLMWIPGESYFLLLPLWHGLDATAVFKAMMNLTTPLRNTDIALGVLMLPVLARVRGTARFGRLISLATAVLVVGSAVYWIPLVLFHRPLLAWMYGGRYEGYAEVLWFLGLYLLISPVTDIFGGGLRALERPDLVFRANVLATVAALTFGLWGIVRWGVVGAGGGLALSSTVRAIATWWYFRDQRRRVHWSENVAGVRPAG
ncbi:MAG TPA: polysaccharide biosynthesis C-terminal domain-containing protein [bacterium]|nr:polysaccharide biosynthesis C-terminal domain-containing protein [bacterium]